MAIDEQHLRELCERASKEQDSKKFIELTEQIERLIAEGSEAREPINPSQVQPLS